MSDTPAIRELKTAAAHNSEDGGKQTHTLSLFVENHPGVLVRVAGLFSRRGYNIESLAVGPTESPQYSRMTIVVQIERSVENLIRQVKKLIPVVGVRELPEGERVDRELMLIKVSVPAGKRAEILEVVQIFRASVVDISTDSLMVEASGKTDKLDALEKNLSAYGIQEICRTGRISLERGSRSLPNTPTDDE